LRTTGALKGVLTTQDLSDAAAVQMAKEWHGLIGVDYVKEVTCSEAFEWDPSGELSKPWLDQYEKSNGVKNDVSASKYHVVAIDYGMKRNILRLLKRQGFSVKVMPATATAEQILKEKPDGVFLSNGPGDPAALDYAHAAVRGIMNRVPIFGICLGHQILGHAFGGTTFKLKFGHRGGNQPVKDLRTNKVTMTSQNHGFAVDPKSLPDDVELTHINLNDQTCEGMQHRKLPIFCVQYHPEASPGPHDATYFFKQFREMIEQNKKS
jgi:carbamoyl-phosphate synthase small subunit